MALNVTISSGQGLEVVVSSEDRDAELVGRIKAGDTTALDALIKAYFAKTYRTVLKLVGSVEDAEDVTQEIFLSLVDSIGSFNGKSAFSTWFHRIVRNKVADHFRRKARKKDEFLYAGDFGECEPHQETITEIEMEDMLKNLPERYRQVLVLRSLRGLSFEQIALILDIKYEAARSRFRRGAKVAARKIDIELLRNH